MYEIPTLPASHLAYIRLHVTQAPISGLTFVSSTLLMCHHVTRLEILTTLLGMLFKNYRTTQLEVLKILYTWEKQWKSCRYCEVKLSPNEVQRILSQLSKGSHKKSP